MTPWVAVGALAGAFALGAALGAYQQDMEGDNELLTEQNQSLRDQIEASDAARKDERNARNASDDVLSQPLDVRVLCRSEPVSGGVPGAGGAVAGDPVRAREVEQDITSRLREALAVDSYNRELIDAAAKRDQKQ